MSIPIEDDSSVEETNTHIIQLERLDELDDRIKLSDERANLTVVDDPTDGELRSVYVVKIFSMF